MKSVDFANLLASEAGNFYALKISTADQTLILSGAATEQDMEEVKKEVIEFLVSETGVNPESVRAAQGQSEWPHIPPVLIAAWDVNTILVIDSDVCLPRAMSLRESAEAGIALEADTLSARCAEFGYCVDDSDMSLHIMFVMRTGVRGVGILPSGEQVVYYSDDFPSEVELTVLTTMSEVIAGGAR